MKILPVIFGALMLQYSVATAQTFSLSISYYTAEKSKDSHSTTESISINGTAVVYSVKYTGRRGPDQTDETKSCVFTSEQITKIQKTITSKNLNVTDSLIINSTAMSSVAISISMTKDGKATKIKVKGSSQGLIGKLLYKNSLYLISMVEKMLERCR